MTRTMTNGIRITAVAACAAAALAVSGCTASDAESAPSAGPTETVSPTPTPDPTAAAEAAAAADAALLPIPADDITAWAKQAVPGSEVEGYLGTFSGWISERSSPSQYSTFSKAEPGEYVITIACRGEGTLTLSIRSVDDQPIGDAVECTNSTIAFDRQSTGDGVGFRLTGVGAPSIYAISFQRVP